MHTSCFKFISNNVSLEEVLSKRVIEVGSKDVNGSPKYIFHLLKPAEYIGVDIEEGPGVDLICRSEELVGKFGENSFDIVISTEMLEHVLDWRIVISNLKRILKPGGFILLSTRSHGFKYHAYPYDFWRYELEDFQKIFSDLQIVSLETDPEAPGVFIKAIKPVNFQENDLRSIKLYESVLNRKINSLSPDDLNSPEFKKRLHLITKRQHAKERKKELGKLLNSFVAHLLKRRTN